MLAGGLAEGEIVKYGSQADQEDNEQTCYPFEGSLVKFYRACNACIHFGAAAGWGFGVVFCSASGRGGCLTRPLQGFTDIAHPLQA